LPKSTFNVRDMCNFKLLRVSRGAFNIMFAIDEVKKLFPNADYRHLTLIGHSNGGDISMFFAKQHRTSSRGSSR